ncbi:MAG: J domain-containing protein [Desulfuromonadaceae bacterium]
MTYRELQRALEILGLPERASLKEIKYRHRKLVKRHHPDRHPEETPERIREINAAYERVRAYCAEYRFCFSQEEFYEQNPEERLRRQFSQDPVWGG